MGSGAPHLDPKPARAPRQKGKNRIIEQKATRTHTKKYREGVLRAIESERERERGRWASSTREPRWGAVYLISDRFLYGARNLGPSGGKGLLN
jgi:hypothetical protein